MAALAVMGQFPTSGSAFAASVFCRLAGASIEAEGAGQLSKPPPSAVASSRLLALLLLLAEAVCAAVLSDGEKAEAKKEKTRPCLHLSGGFTNDECL